MTEKTEKATPYKLQKSKEKGQVSKSIELTTSLSLLVMLGMVTALWPKVLFELKALMTQLLTQAFNTPFKVDYITHLQTHFLSKLLNLWLPFALATLMTIILVTVAQTGLIWSFTPLIPDFKRLSWSQGLKKLFSMKTCFEAIKSSIKLCLTSLLLYYLISGNLSQILQLAFENPNQNAFSMITMLLKTVFKLLLLLTSLAIFDLLYTRWKYKKDNRMSKQEVKDEHKQREGDPKIKAKIKQLQYKLRQKATSLKEVQTADVVITNPTHLAIALQYDSKTMPAPKVVCKAQGEMVAQVKSIAYQHGVPIVENKLFARALYHSVELNQCLSSNLFPVAAGIFREIYSQRNAV